MPITLGSLYSQQLSIPWICSQNLMFLHSALAYASRHTSQTLHIGLWHIPTLQVSFGPVVIDQFCALL